MPWKLILFILAIVLVTIFIGFNLTNSCDVSFGVYTFKEVPIFMSILLAFALGVLVMLPFTFGHGKKEKSSAQSKKASVNSSTSSTSSSLKKVPTYSDSIPKENSTETSTTTSEKK